MLAEAGKAVAQGVHDHADPHDVKMHKQMRSQKDKSGQDTASTPKMVQAFVAKSTPSCSTTSEEVLDAKEASRRYSTQ